MILSPNMLNQKPLKQPKYQLLKLISIITKSLEAIVRHIENETASLAKTKTFLVVKKRVKTWNYWIFEALLTQ